MSDFLTRRHGTWHFVRRVPSEFAAIDARGIIRHSTKIRIAQDRTGRRASRVADKLNRDLEAFWRASAAGPARDLLARYEATRRCARSLGFEYVDNEQVLQLPIEGLLNRLEALVAKGVGEPVNRAALLGTEKRPAFPLSKLFEEFEQVVAEEIKDLSPEQLRIWRNGRIRAVAQFVDRVRATSR